MVQGYAYAKYFAEECQKFSKVGLQLSETVSGIDSVMTKDWKERNCNLDKWIVQDPEFEIRFWNKIKNYIYALFTYQEYFLDHFSLVAWL